MAPDELHKIQVAFAIVGATIGFLVGKYARDQFQAEGTLGLLSLVGAVLFYYAAFYLFLLVLAAAAFGFCRLAWRYRAVWTPILEPLLRRFARWQQSPPSVADQLLRAQDEFDAHTEAVLTQPYSPDDKRLFLEQLESQHKNRVRRLLGNDDSLSGH